MITLPGWSKMAREWSANSAWRAASINYLARPMPDGRLYGFELFEGLLEDWRANAKEWTFKQRALPSVASSVGSVCGLFVKNLPVLLEEHQKAVLLMHIDCDLSSSTPTVFELVSGRIRSGTIILLKLSWNLSIGQR
jgi:hypothetical protein